MDSDLVHYELDGHVATITLSRPELRNVLSFRTEDQRGCAAAFLEKREPVFKGR